MAFNKHEMNEYVRKTLEALFDEVGPSGLTFAQVHQQSKAAIKTMEKCLNKDITDTEQVRAHISRANGIIKDKDLDNFWL